VEAERLRGGIICHNKREEEGPWTVDAMGHSLGFIADLGPIKEWGLEMEKGSIKVNSRMETNLPGIYSAGDVATFDGKLKLIATGFAEAAVAVAQAVHEIRPEVKIQPKYSTNTGVPGAVAGQP